VRSPGTLGRPRSGARRQCGTKPAGVGAERRGPRAPGRGDWRRAGSTPRSADLPDYGGTRGSLGSRSAEPTPAVTHRAERTAPTLLSDRRGLHAGQGALQPTAEAPRGRRPRGTPVGLSQEARGDHKRSRKQGGGSSDASGNRAGLAPRVLKQALAKVDKSTSDFCADSERCSSDDRAIAGYSAGFIAHP
jgi:hypothetical protein